MRYLKTVARRFRNGFRETPIAGPRAEKKSKKETPQA